MSEKYYTLMLLPYDVPDYLNELKENIPSNRSQNIQIESYSIKMDFRTNETHGHCVYIYNINGVLEQYSVYYDNLTAYNLKLSYYRSGYHDTGGCGGGSLFWLLLYGAGAIFIMALCSYFGMKSWYKIRRRTLWLDEVKR